MYLKSLELQGFKSFPDKTVLDFKSGSTVIIGPNGSGKSNITDAMRWVLGELSSKNIRGTKMDDVIFAGAKGRSPMSYAEVSVTFDNTSGENRINSPYDEITVTRRIFRAGESEYYINRKPVRLKDIYELFMNTGIGREGYSIIGQGRISEILSKRNEDRRSIFEEASGISKYRHKKNEAEKKLAATHDNMTRVSEILTELTPRVATLEKESARAHKYLELFDRKKEADVSLWLFDADKHRRRADEASKQFALSQHELEMIEDTINSLETQDERLFESSQENKLASERLGTKIAEATAAMHAKDSEIRVLENDLAHARERLIALGGAEDAGAERVASAKAELETAEDALVALEAENTALDVRHAALVAEKEAKAAEEARLGVLLEERLAERRALEQERMDAQVRLSVLEKASEAERQRREALLSDIETYRKAGEELAARAQAHRKTLSEYTAQVTASDETIAARAGELETLRDRAKAAERALSEGGAELAAAEQRRDALVRMQEHFEGYHNSVKYVMRAHEERRLTDRSGRVCPGVYGPVSRLITVEREYATAVETALGASMQNIVVEDEETAKAAIYALKNAGAGRATFCPISSVKPQKNDRETADAEKYGGFLGTADTLVSCDEKYRGVILSLLGRTVVFDTLENASKMAKATGYRVRAVTLDGQQINAGGSFTGGSTKRDSGVLTRAGDIEALEKRIAALKTAQEKAKADLAALEKDARKIESDIHAEDEKKQIFLVMARTEQTSLDATEAQISVNEKLLADLGGDADRIRTASEASSGDAETLMALCAELEAKIAAIDELRADLDAERYERATEAEAVQAQINAHLIAVAEHKKDIEAAQLHLLRQADALKAAEEALLGTKREGEELTAKIGAMGAQITEGNTTLTAMREALEGFTKERATVDEGQMEYDRRLAELRKTLKDKMAEKELIFRAHTKNESKLGSLHAEIDRMTTRLWDEYQLTHTSAMALGYPEVTEETRGEIAAVLTECKNKLRALGNVNLDAIEQYATEKERYEYLSSQMADLEASEKDLRRLIDDIEKEMKENFVDAFNRINVHFGEVFAELFGGGVAEISLTDPENVLTSGIEIKAAPPGKMIKSLSLLSGGEQAFVAIALVFAILKVNPSPFCIFDEIEAALDEVNVTRFAEYIRRDPSETQFVIITHRRGTMEIADTLYGVTMVSQGISKVLSLSVDDIENHRYKAE